MRLPDGTAAERDVMPSFDRLGGCGDASVKLLLGDSRS